MILSNFIAKAFKTISLKGGNGLKLLRNFKKGLLREICAKFTQTQIWKKLMNFVNLAQISRNVNM